MKKTYNIVNFINENKGLVFFGAIAVIVIFTIGADAGAKNPQLQ